MIDPLAGGRPILAAAFVVTLTLQMKWENAHAEAILPKSGDGGNMEDMSEEGPTDISVVSGKQENATSVDVINVQNEFKAENRVLVALIATDAPVVPQVAPRKNEGEKTIQYPVEDPALYVNNATESGGYEIPAFNEVLVTTYSAGSETLVTKSEMMESAALGSAGQKSAETESSVADIPTQTMEPVIPTQSLEPIAIVAATTKPSLRIEEPAETLETIKNDDARTQATGYMQQSNNPLVFVALAAICCIFLFVWGRKRRSGTPFKSSTADSTSPKGLKVQYMKVPDEQPSSHGQDYDDEYCDDYEEDTFTNDRDNWDDWEGDSTQTQLNPFAVAPSAPRSTPLRLSNPSVYKLTQPLPPLPQQHAHCQESGVAIKGDVLLSSVESNSSSDSFEVVTDVIQGPPISSHDAVANAENESESVDNLFSQFGMVLPVKKRVIVPPSPATTSATSVFLPAVTATARSAPSFPTAAEASALFAAEMEDELTAVDAAEEWGEDDEWVKSI